MPTSGEFEAHIEATKRVFANRESFAHLEFEHDCAVAFEDMCRTPSIMRVYEKLYTHDAAIVRNAIRIAVDVVIGYVARTIRRGREGGIR